MLSGGESGGESAQSLSPGGKQGLGFPFFFSFPIYLREKCFTGWTYDLELPSPFLPSYCPANISNGRDLHSSIRELRLRSAPCMPHL